MALTRGIDSALLAAISGPFNPVVLIYVDWPSDPVRVHNGIGTLTWGGHSWLGVGTYGEMQLPEEGTGLAATSGMLRIGGLPEEIDAYLEADVRNRDVEVWFGAVTTRAGNVLIGEPVSIFAGYIDGMSDQEEASGTGRVRSIELSIASGASQRSRSSAHHSYEDQITAYPDDTAGRWCKGSRAQIEAINW